jgi:hypothetical protein
MLGVHNLRTVRQHEFSSKLVVPILRWRVRLNHIWLRDYDYDQHWPWRHVPDTPADTIADTCSDARADRCSNSRDDDSKFCNDPRGAADSSSVARSRRAAVRELFGLVRPVRVSESSVQFLRQGLPRGRNRLQRRDQRSNLWHLSNRRSDACSDINEPGSVRRAFVIECVGRAHERCTC